VHTGSLSPSMDARRESPATTRSRVAALLVRFALEILFQVPV
jgi:hypothetical protein